MIKNYPPLIRSFLTLLLTVSSVFLANAATTVEMSSFSSVGKTNIAGDANVYYTTAQGDAGTAPAINDGEIRLYQNSAGTGGGTITIHAVEGYVLTDVTIGSSMATSIAHTIGESTEKSSTKSLAANGRHTVNGIDSNSITFYCMGTSKSSRLYVNYLSVTYKSTSTEPAISVSPTELNFSAFAGEASEAQTVTLTLENMESFTSVTVTSALTGTGADCFAVAKTSDTEYSVTFNAPDKAGTYTASLTFSASADGNVVATSPTITLTGVANLAAPVAVAASDISNTSFTACWNEVTGAASYKVDVYKKGEVVTKTNTYANPDTKEFDCTTTDGGRYDDKSLKMSATGHCVETQNFEQAITSVGFTIKNNDAAAENKLILYGKNAQMTDYAVIKEWSVTDIATNTKQGSVEEPIDGDYTQVKLEYAKIGNGNVGLYKLSVSYGGAEYVVRDQSAATTSYSVENLEPATTYYYTVRAADDTHVSDKSNEVEVTTFNVVTVSTYPTNNGLQVLDVLKTNRLSITFNKPIASYDESLMHICYTPSSTAPAEAPRSRQYAAPEPQTQTLGVNVLDATGNTLTFQADTWNTCVPEYGTTYDIVFDKDAVTFDDGQTSPAITWDFKTITVPTGIQGVEAAQTLLYDGRSVTASNGARICLYNLAGARIAEGSGSLSLESLAPGIYVARCGSATMKVVKR